MAVRNATIRKKPASTRKTADEKGKKKKSVVVKAAAKPARSSARTAAVVAAPSPALPGDKNFASIWATREKKLTQLFGAPFPKGKVLDANGENITLQTALAARFCTWQFSPTDERMSWLYVTLGLSQRGPAAELAILSKFQDGPRAAHVLNKVADYAASGKDLVRPGELIPAETTSDGGPGLQNWIVCPPDRSLPAQIETSNPKVNLLLLMGITEAEMQSALRVKPELADGPQVLIEALRVGGIYPVTDLRRNCLTRRGDFNRLWENAFRAVRERSERR